MEESTLICKGTSLLAHHIAYWLSGLDKNDLNSRLENGRKYFNLQGIITLDSSNRILIVLIGEKNALIRDWEMHETKYLKHQPPFADSFADIIANSESRSLIFFSTVDNLFFI